MKPESDPNPLERMKADGMGMAPLSVDAALAWTGWLLERLKTVKDTKDDTITVTVVWASQKTLAARYDMSMSSMGRYLSKARELRCVRILRPEREGKAGNARYNVEDMDAFMSGQGKK